MNPEQTQEILNLRDRKLTAKQIARKLGLKVAEVNAVIKAQAEQSTLALEATGELEPVTKCLVNVDCARRLLENNSQPDSQLYNPNEIGGLGSVTVVRTQGYNRFVVCTYLIDYWCLGLKDTIGPRKLDISQCEKFIDQIYSQFSDGYQEITLEQAQAIIFGAIDYAAKLGFSPHPDFNQTKAHLGEWSGQPQLEFGCNGKPLYIEGPYDNSKRIMNTLTKNIGAGNFEYIASISEDSFFELS